MPSVLQVLRRPVSALKCHWAPDCTRSHPARLSHPLINSTQHHFLHSLTVPSLCACWRQRPEPLPWRRLQRWEDERWQRTALESKQQQVERLQHFDPPRWPLPIAASLCPPVQVLIGLREAGWWQWRGLELFKLKALIEWKCYESIDLFRESLSFWFHPSACVKTLKGAFRCLRGQLVKQTAEADRKPSVAYLCIFCFFTSGHCNKTHFLTKKITLGNEFTWYMKDKKRLHSEIFQSINKTNHYTNHKMRIDQSDFKKTPQCIQVRPQLKKHMSSDMSKIN